MVGLFHITDSQLKEFMNGVDKFRIQLTDNIIHGNFGESVEINTEEIDFKFCFRELGECLYAGLASLNKILNVMLGNIQQPQQP